MMGVLRMRIYDMGKGESSVTYNYSVWAPQALFIKWVVENKSILNQANAEMGAYMSLTGSLCSLVESVCEYVLRTSISYIGTFHSCIGVRKRFRGNIPS